MEVRIPSLWDLLTEGEGTMVYLATTAGPQWTYDDLRRDVAGASEALRQSGVRPGHGVALKIADPGCFVVWLFAILAAGAIAVPINPRAPEDDARRTLETSHASYWVAEPHQIQALDAPSPPWTTDNPGVILLTSGSTGDPKPVGLPWPSLLHTARQVAEAHQFTSSDRGFSPLPLFHINALVVALLGSLVAKSRILIAERFHASTFWETVDRDAITWINAVPAILAVLTERPEVPVHPERVRFIRSASAPLPEAIRHRAESRFGIGIVETYGMTEASSQITANLLPGHSTHPGSVGIPRGVEVRVAGKDGRALGARSRGAIEIRGPGVIDPDWGPNQWARQVMRDGWYPTGDIGYLNENGYLFLSGRGRDVINRGGEKIFPREVEDWFLIHPAIAECALVGRPHPLLGEVPILFVVPNPAAHFDDAALRDWASEGLAAFKQPVDYVVVESLPKGPTGKVSRPQLRRLARTRQPAHVHA